MQGKKWILVLIALLSLSLIFAGCGGTTPDPKQEAEAPKEPEVKEKVLVFARGGDSVGLDPANETDGESFYVSRNITLTRRHIQWET